MYLKYGPARPLGLKLSVQEGTARRCERLRASELRRRHDGRKTTYLTIRTRARAAGGARRRHLRDLRLLRVVLLDDEEGAWIGLGLWLWVRVRAMTRKVPG